MNLSSNFLQDLALTAADALSNLYYVEFSGGEFTDETTSTNMSVRCDGFTPPSISQPNYTVRFINEHIDRPSTKVDVTRNFTLQFRVDAAYQVYKALLKQQQVMFDPNKSFTATDLVSLKDTANMFNVKVYALKGMKNSDSNDAELLFTFKNCWISSIAPLKFSYSSGDPISVSVTINFIEMEDLQVNL